MESKNSYAIPKKVLHHPHYSFRIRPQMEKDQDSPSLFLKARIKGLEASIGFLPGQ
jgi:hypothetical protein